MKSKTGPDNIGSKNSMHKCVNAHIGQTQSYSLGQSYNLLGKS